MKSSHRHQWKMLAGPRRSVLGLPLPHRGDRGQVLVEFVLVLPILLVLVIGIIEFANAWRTSQTITNVAREGARYAVVAGGPSAGDEAEVQDSVATLLNSAGLDGSSATINVTLSSDSGDPDEVTIRYPYEFIFFGPAFNMIGGDGSNFGTITLATTTSMRNE